MLYIYIEMLSKVYICLLLIYCISAYDSNHCEICKLFVYSFQLGLDTTSKSHFAGGNTAWETEKLGRYSTSETRLVEVLETSCKKSIDGNELSKNDEHKCHSLVENFEEHIENWYFHRQSSSPDFYKWLCIDTIKQCCPNGTFGLQCLPCLTGPNQTRPCFGNGKCDGDGTREGTGKCICDSGYQGKLCRKCAVNFYASQQNETDIICSRCDQSCKGECSGPGPNKCAICNTGYEMVEGIGCKDINECQLKYSCMQANERCVNTEGSFRCECIDGYKRVNSDCVLENVSADNQNYTDSKNMIVDPTETEKSDSEPHSNTAVGDADLLSSSSHTHDALENSKQEL